MKITFSIADLPPKKDGANSMWRKGSELRRLKTLRKAAHIAMQEKSLSAGEVRLTVRLYAERTDGDLDNFITGICDGLMAAHPNTPIDEALWTDMPLKARPNHPIVYRDDLWIRKIDAERFAADGASEHCEVELEWDEEAPAYPAG